MEVFDQFLCSGVIVTNYHCSSTFPSWSDLLHMSVVGDGNGSGDGAG